MLPDCVSNSLIVPDNLQVEFRKIEGVSPEELNEKETIEDNSKRNIGNKAKFKRKEHDIMRTIKTEPQGISYQDVNSTSHCSRASTPGPSSESSRCATPSPAYQSATDNSINAPNNESYLSEKEPAKKSGVRRKRKRAGLLLQSSPGQCTSKNCDTQDEHAQFGNYVAAKLRKMNSFKQELASRMISEVLFLANCDKLTIDSKIT